VLMPADVDPVTGYRRYRQDQLQTARAIAALRDLELSLPAIRALLEADEPGERQAVLADEKRRLEARTARLQRALHRLSMLANASAQPVSPSPASAPSPMAGSARQAEVPSVPTPPTPPTLDAATHRQLGAGLYNRTWDLLEVEDRTADQDDELVDTAHASAWHWRQVGNEANASRAHWILSRVYAVLGRGQEALYHARRQNEIIELGGEGFEPWDAPSGAEAMARALALAGDTAGAVEWKARASQLVTAIPGAEDRAVIENDIATIPV
jgi:DNA-binding transcriptional MerR regulator